MPGGYDIGEMKPSAPQAGLGITVRRRLSDDIAADNLALVQLHLFEREGGAHHTSDLGIRIARLHRRLDDLEAHLRARAKARDVDPTLPMSQLLRELRISLARHFDGRRLTDG
jgi:hypothetical protein